MLVSEEYSEPNPECILQPGDVLLRCNGQDIVKKNGMNKSSKHRILTIFPCQFLLANKMNDTKIGMLHNLSSSTPEYHLETEDGMLVFPGRFEYPTTKFLSIQCHPGSHNNSSSSTGGNNNNSTTAAMSSKTKNASCVLTDMFDRILIFDQPSLKAKSSSPSSSTVKMIPSAMISSDNDNSGYHVGDTTSDPHQYDEEKDDHPWDMTQVTTATAMSSSKSEICTTTIAATTISNIVYNKHFGMSSLADPVKLSNTARTTTTTQNNKANKSNKVSNKAVIKDDESIASAASESLLPQIIPRPTGRRQSAGKAISYKENTDDEEDEEGGDDDSDHVIVKDVVTNNDSKERKKTVDKRPTNITQRKDLIKDPKKDPKKTVAVRPTKKKKIQSDSDSEDDDSFSEDGDEDDDDDDSDFEIPVTIEKNQKKRILSSDQKTSKATRTIATTGTSKTKSNTTTASSSGTKKQKLDTSAYNDSDIEIIEDNIKETTQKNKSPSNTARLKNRKTNDNTVISESHIITIVDDD